MSEEEVIDTPPKAKKSKRTTIPTAKAEWVAGRRERARQL